MDSILQRFVEDEDKIKVAFLIAEPFPELIGTFLQDQVIGLINEGVDVTVFALGKKPNHKPNSDFLKYNLFNKTHYINVPCNKWIRISKAIPIIFRSLFRNPISVFKSFNTKKYGKMALTLNLLFCYDYFSRINEEFDILHTHFGQIGLIGSYLKEVKVTKKLVASFYGGDVIKYPKDNGEDIYKPLFNNADRLTGNTEFIKKKLESLGCDKEKTEVILIAFNPSKFYPRKNYTKVEKPIRIITIGRLIEEKGHKYTIAAFAKLCKKYKNIEYVIVGSGPLKDELINQASQLGIKDKVKFLGRVDDDEILKQYQESHIFVLSSVKASYGSEEGQGMTNQESQLVELPVISTNIGGIPEGILEDKTGFIVPEKNEDLLAEKLDILVKNPKMRIEMGKAGRKFVEEKYSHKKIINSMIEMYKKI